MGQTTVGAIKYEATKMRADRLDAHLATLNPLALEGLKTNQEILRLNTAQLKFLIERIEARLALLRASEVTPPAPIGPAPAATPKIKVQPAAPNPAPTIPAQLPTNAPVTPAARGPVQSAKPLRKPDIEPRTRTPEGRSRPDVI